MKIDTIIRGIYNKYPHCNADYDDLVGPAIIINTFENITNKFESVVNEIKAENKELKKEIEELQERINNMTIENLL